MKYLYSLLVLSLLTACGSQPASFTGTPSCVISNGPQWVYAYGDSITRGVQGTGVSGCMYNEVYTYAMINGYSFDDRAIGGTTAASPNQVRLMSDTFKPGSIVVYTSGVNDAFFHQHDPAYLAYYTATIQAIVDNLASQQVIAYVGTDPTPVPRPDLDQTDLDMYNNIVRQIVAAKNSPNVILFDIASNLPVVSDNYVDGTHPSYKGYNLITDYLLNILK